MKLMYRPRHLDQTPLVPCTCSAGPKESTVNHLWPCATKVEVVARLRLTPENPFFYGR